MPKPASLNFAWWLAYPRALRASKWQSAGIRMAAEPLTADVITWEDAVDVINTAMKNTSRRREVRSLPGHVLSDIRVYIVEDQALIRQCLRAMLDLEEDMSVVGEAEAAEEALEDLRSVEVDLVLMDIGLPGMDGIAATQTLRERRPELPIVMLTAYQSEFVAKALWAGASGYILKTSTRQQLVQSIRAACNNQVPIDAAMAANLFSTAAHSSDARKDSLLTDRQVDVLKLVANGVRYRDIASELFVSETTVNREMRDIFNRLGVNDATHAVSEAYQKHLL